jgi:O-acetyl-ADP-ribose deacetylase (regulator of RNase III)
MITYVEGDLLQSKARVLVNAVNTVGVMGKGIALRFKQAYPEMFKEYQQWCEQKQLTIGKLWLYKTPQKWILNFPTKEHWRAKSKMEHIEVGLQKFVATYREKGIREIAFPMLGCGNGELDWEIQIQPLMEKHLSKLPIAVYVYNNLSFE